MSKNTRFYILCVVTLLIISAYPVINGAGMAYINITDGTLRPEDYTRYVIPYAAVCVSLIFYSLFEPLFFKLKKFAYPAGFILTLGVFFAVEVYFESMQILVTGMTLINTTTGAYEYAAADNYIFIVENNADKIRYYIISFVLILMITSFIHTIAKMYRKNGKPRSKPLLIRCMATVVFISLCVFATGAALFKLPEPVTVPDDDISGCYVFARNVYTNPLSSFAAPSDASLPYVYGFDEENFYHAGKGSIGFNVYAAQYYNALAPEDELPGAGLYTQRYLRAVVSQGGTLRFALYQMDGELWLVQFGMSGAEIWCIYQIEKTEATTLDDLMRAAVYYARYKPVALDPYSYTDDGLLGYPVLFENQMTVKDIYALARLGEELSIADFAPYCYWLTGDDFAERLFEVAGGDTVYVRSTGAVLDSVLLLSRRAVDPSQVIDLREGIEAVAAYLNPLGSFMDISIAHQPGIYGSELLFADDYSGLAGRCVYYLDIGGTEQAFVTFNDTGERMGVREALQERRLTIEDLVAGGLRGVVMVPEDNPLGGRFTNISGLQTFRLGSEAFFPSKTFMYALHEDITADGAGGAGGAGGGGAGPADQAASDLIAYFNFNELLIILTLYGYDTAEIISLYDEIPLEDIFEIAGDNYLDIETLSRIGVNAVLAWESSLNTPVWISIPEAETDPDDEHLPG